MNAAGSAAALLAIATIARCGADASQAQDCTSDEDCGRQVCELGRCVRNADERTEASALGPPLASSLASDAPTLRFRFDLGARIAAAPALTPEGDVLVAALDGRVVRLGSDGTPRVEARLPHGVRSSPAVDVAGRVAIATLDGTLRLLDARLRETARLPLGAPIEGPIRVVAAGVFAVPTRGLALIDVNGVELARIPAPSLVRSGATPGPGGTLAFATPEGELVVARNGAVLFRAALEASADDAPTPAPDGSWLIGTDLGHVLRISAEGHVVARFEAALDVRASPILLPDGTIVAASLDGIVHGLDSGLVERYATAIPGRILASPLVDRAGRLVIATTAGRIHLLDGRGHELAMLVVGAPIPTPPVLTPDGTLIVVSDDGFVRGFR